MTKHQQNTQRTQRAVMRALRRGLNTSEEIAAHCRIHRAHAHRTLLAMGYAKVWVNTPEADMLKRVRANE